MENVLAKPGSGKKGHRRPGGKGRSVGGWTMWRTFLGGIFRKAPRTGEVLKGKEDLAVAMEKLGKMASPESHVLGGTEGPVHRQ